MTKRTRVFVGGAGGFLALGLTTGLLASYAGLQVPVFSRAAGPNELQYLPPDVSMVAYANVRNVLQSPLHERFRSLEPNRDERNDFESRTGLSFERDVDTVVAATLGAPTGGTGDGPDEATLLIARGRFEPGRLESFAVEKGGRVDTYQGVRIVSGGNQEMRSLAFLEADLVAVGSPGAVKQAIDARRSGRTLTSNTSMMQQIATLDGNAVWALGRFDAFTRAHVPSEMQAHLPAVTWFAAAGQVDSGLSGSLKAEARDDEAAQNLRDMLRGFVAMAKLQAGSKPEMAPMLQALQLGGEGRTIEVQFALPAEAIDALEPHMRRRRGQAQPE